MSTHTYIEISLSYNIFIDILTTETHRRKDKLLLTSPECLEEADKCAIAMELAFVRAFISDIPRPKTRDILTALSRLTQHVETLEGTLDTDPGTSVRLVLGRFQHLVDHLIRMPLKVDRYWTPPLTLKEMKQTVFGLSEE